VKKALLSLLTCFVFSISMMAHNNEPSNGKLISGKVIDKQTGEALVGVKIQLNGTDTFCYTDMNGNYLLSLPAKTEVEITVDMAGYAPLYLKSTETGLDKDLILSPR